MTSPLFERCGWMPDRCAGYGADLSPELHVGGLPDGASALAIVLDDLDHPVKLNYSHWVAWNLPPVSVLPEALRS